MMTASLIIQQGTLTIDMERYVVSVRGTPVPLTYREYAVLVYLATHAGYVVATRRLLEEGLGRHDPWSIRTVGEIIQSLKRKLETNGQRFLEEVPGEGHRFLPQVTSI
mgnify:CR=1 FL=1